MKINEVQVNWFVKVDCYCSLKTRGAPSSVGHEGKKVIVMWNELFNILFLYVYFFIMLLISQNPVHWQVFHAWSLQRREQLSILAWPYQQQTSYDLQVLSERILCFWGPLQVSSFSACLCHHLQGSPLVPPLLDTSSCCHSPYCLFDTNQHPYTEVC